MIIIKCKRTFSKFYGNRAEINSMHKVTKIPGKVQNTRKYDNVCHAEKQYAGAAN